VCAQVRRLLAEMGFRSIDEIVGRSDLLKLKEGACMCLCVPAGDVWEP
jgi:hypothetical protein